MENTKNNSIKEILNHFHQYKENIQSYKLSLTTLDNILNTFADRQDEFSLLVLNNSQNLRLVLRNFERSISVISSSIIKEKKQARNFRINGYESLNKYLELINPDSDEIIKKLTDLASTLLDNKNTIIEMIENANHLFQKISGALSRNNILSHRVVSKIKNAFSQLRIEHYEYLDSNDESINILKIKIM